MSTSTLILYKWREQQECNLPSLSPACIQAEAYLRFCNAAFQVHECASTSKSPSGQLPALECQAEIIGTERDAFAASRSVIGYTSKHVRDLDAWLTASHRAELLAFVGLIRDALDVATDYCMWIEPRGFREHKAAAYDVSLPFPLNYVVPWTLRREAQRRHGERGAEEVYAQAVEALGAFADRLRESTGHFFFGSKPTSLDALLAGHLAFYRASPAAAPVLAEKVSSDAALSTYVDHVLTTYFATSAPTASISSRGRGADDGTGASSSTSSWSTAGKGSKGPRPSPKAEPSAAELQARRKAWYWMAGATAAVVCYALYSGGYSSLQQAFGLEYEVLGDDDGDDDDE